ncbi:type II and III secretion system protein family protein [Parablastomonas sp. CN1-191]|uniref:type II and III secretion system protein family protein n=1 Tax=Parablastomonas sp. CN1-191 TaxID=3400908 RepID=UPI003BF7C93F
MNRSLPLLLAASLAAPLALAAPAAQAQSVSRPMNDLVLSIGRGQLITVPGAMADVFVANDDIADVQVKSRNQLYVFGKAGGTTTVYASNAAGQVVYSANVRVGSNLDSVDQMLALAMPDAHVSVATMGTNTFLLTGTVASPEDAAEAARLVQAYSGKDANVISRLRTATPLQVNLRVRFAEVSRTLVRSIGVNLTSVDTSGGFKFGIGQGRTSGMPSFTPGSPGGLGVGRTEGPTGGSVVTNSGTGSTLGFAGKLLGLDLLGALDLGERLGLVTSLSEPNLTALSGETADFLAGGEYPIPISQGLGTTSIEYKRFGVSLAYTPTVLANGRISLRVRPEVSELSAQGAITLNGFQVPALTVRRAETTIELGSGQSFMIAGLMSNGAQNQIQKAPGLGDIPILGSLFRSTNFQRGDTELVIVVTPYLVNPVNASEIKYPTDGYQNASDIQRLLGNMENDGKSGAQRPMPSSAPADVTGTGPRVGAIETPADLYRALGNPAAAGGADSKDKRKKSKQVQTASAAPAPGFNLN